MEIINKTLFPIAPYVGRVGFPKHSLTLIVKGTFDLVHKGTATISEEQLFPTGDELYSDDDEGDGSHFYGSDFAYFKPRADLLLAGKCCSPGGQPIQACKVTFGVGAQSKTLGVFGDRYWSQITKIIFDPQPFTEMELRYENSFGGEGFKKNPVGKGYGTLKHTDGMIKRPLPNIEDLKHLVDSPNSQPEPVGFGPVDSLWPQRYAKLGTYEGSWLKERWPWYPTDFDWGYYNAAPVDMQVEGYLNGDESLYFENLHPSISHYHSRLPGLRPRLFISKQDAARQDESLFFESDLNLDTLWVDMEAEKLVLVWRTVIEVLSEDYDEVGHVFMAAESMDDPRKTEEYYHDYFLKRFEQKDEAALDENPTDYEEFPETEDIDIDEEIKKVEDEIRVACIEAGIDPDQDIPEPTEEDKQEEIRILKELGIEPDVEKIPFTREMIMDRIARGEGFCGEDLSTIDLSGLDLQGVDFSDAILDGANFEKSILTKADFTNANLQKVSFVSANLKGAVLKDADLTLAVLTGADLSEADIQDAIFDQANLQNTLFDSCNAENVSFLGSDLTDASLKNMQGRAADFSKSKLVGADFRCAILIEASVEDAVGVGVNMKDADLSGLKASGKTNFSKGCFQKVLAPYSIWENAILDEADFSLSSMEGANFASASLKLAVFIGADLKFSRLSKADLYQAKCMTMNLFEATLEKANLTRTDFRASNMYGAEFLDSIIDGTMFGDANLKMTKLSKK